MDKSWLKFRNVKNNLPPGMVGVAKGGGMTISGEHTEQLGHPSYVVLYFNAQRNACAIVPTTIEDPDRYKFMTSGKSSYRLKTNRFFEYHNIPHKIPARYPAHVEANDDGPMLVIELEPNP